VDRHERLRVLRAFEQEGLEYVLIGAAANGLSRPGEDDRGLGIIDPRDGREHRDDTARRASELRDGGSGDKLSAATIVVTPGDGFERGVFKFRSIAEAQSARERVTLSQGKEDLMRRALFLIVFVAGSLVVATSAAAVEERPHTLALYGLGAFIDGDMTFGELDTEVDVDVSDIMDSLETAAFARYRYQNEQWGFVVDGQFAGLGDTGEEGNVRTHLDMDLLVIQADGAYRFSDTAEALIGVRYVRFEGEVDVHFLGDGSIHRENDASFWDPVIGLRTLVPLGEKLRLQAQGDVGGGANMDFTWQGMIHVGYQVSDGLSLWGGYRGIGMEFDDSGGRNRIDADIVMHGPEVGVAFHF
jgi:opacity protein-like surface antigen